MESTKATPKSPMPDGLEKLRGAIRAFILSRLKDPALADDITQETFLKLHKRLGTLRTPKSLQAWVFQIAKNALVDHLRSQRPAPEPLDEEVHTKDGTVEAHGVQAAEDEALRAGLSSYVRSVAEGLPEIYRDALLATEFEGLSQVELARRLGLSASAAKSRVQRGRALVKAEMERCCKWKMDQYGNVLDVKAKSPRCCNDGNSSC